MAISALLVFALALAVAAGSPGPIVAALVARVLARGPAEVLPLLLGSWLGEAAWLTVAVAGLAAVARNLGAVFVALKYAGALYLLYLAWKMWIGEPEAETEAAQARQPAWRLFAGGLAVALGNPKIIIFYVALLPALLDIGHVGAFAWLELVLTMLATLAVVDGAWIALAARARRFLQDRRSRRMVNRGGALVIAGAAAAIAAL